MTITAETADIETEAGEVTSFVEELIARIDEHLASMPSERKLVSVEDHTDVLLDIRLLAAKGRPADFVAALAGPKPAPATPVSAIDPDLVDEFAGMDLPWEDDPST